MGYSILTYCSKNYMDAFNFSIDSWLKIKADKIIIYTDFDLKFNSNRVEIVKHFRPSKKWLVNVGRKIPTILHYLKRDNAGQIVFLDMDCYIVNDFSEVFEKDFDLAATRFFSEHAETISTGVWFARANERVIEFMERWDRLSYEYKIQGRGMKIAETAYEQYSFSDLARKTYKNELICKILPLEEKIYNCEHDNIEKWKEDIKEYHPKIIHFKKKSFTNKKFVTEIFKLAGVK